MKKYQFITLFAVCLSVTILAGCGTTNTSDKSSIEQDSLKIATTTVIEGDKIIIETDQINYNVPKHHIESIKLKTTLDKETKTIQAIEIQNSENDHESAEYQRDFNQGIKAQVIGKPIDQASVGTINGASLTSQAFNLAIEQIMEKGLSSNIS